MKNQKAALGFIFVTVLIDVIGLGIIIPVIPKLIMELSGENVSQASRYGGWLMFIYAFMQFIFSPILGGLSDKFGRRPILLFSLFGLGIDYLLVAFSSSLWWLFLARLIAGIGGASFTTASAYIADISTPEKRTQNFGMLGAAFGLGFIIGPVIGGILGDIGSRIPFFAAAAIALLNWLYGYFMVPESLPKENRRPFTMARANPFGTFKQLKKHPLIIGLSITLFYIYIAHHATQSTWAYFTIERFQWDEAQVGYSFGYVGLMIVLVQGVIIRHAVRILGQVKAIYVGLSFNMLGMLLIAFSTEGWMIYVVMFPYAMGGLAGPTMQALMSTKVNPDEQGELQGGLTSLMSITSIIGPPLMTTIFAYFTSDDAPFYFPGSPFILGTILCGIGFIFAIRTLRGINKPS
ncbi:MAG: TCR/Tet family MFS transporter [Flammeovirgaceae bacterium]|nr:TCR/Tet family MFS transporter [Flammeovirgaceae bacterium]